MTSPGMVVVGAGKSGGGGVGTLIGGKAHTP